MSYVNRTSKYFKIFFLKIINCNVNINQTYTCTVTKPFVTQNSYVRKEEFNERPNLFRKLFALVE